MSKFSNCLIDWYKINRRELLWRDNPTPYRVWLSEIILQQTRIVQGTGYFHRLIERFPNIKMLAEATEEEVLKLWQGLGYYSRARNLHSAAKTIINEFHGKFPCSYDEILKLKGIGDYTAAAIASIAFNLPYPAIDGNAFRVMSRIFGIYEPTDTSAGKKTFLQLANELIDPSQPGTYNEAVMELGATVCHPKNPLCNHCPLEAMCFAYINNKIDELPIKKKKPKQRKRYFHFLLIEENEYIYIQQRTDNDIWKSLFQLPVIESKNAQTPEDIINSNEFNSILGTDAIIIKRISEETIHKLTHQKLFIRFLHVQITSPLNSKTYLRVDKKDIATFAVPKPIELFFKNFFTR